ncbi:hypothetical protein BC833DRAFT_581403 [Globomyces pollinis-pini]|nr:hypothetical protein BC833DRAFT_581403 [Globomyces pollinis-pini]KAJ2999720.1 hypothetical protein HDV02_001963 [Globomyces sp. JEL0801]
MSTTNDWITKVDLTSLDLDKETKESILQLCDKSIKFNTASVCVYPTHIPLIKSHHPKLTVATVINFPLGNESKEIVQNTTQSALNNGADELDLVWDYNAFNDNRYDDALAPIHWVKETVKSYFTSSSRKIVLKVILESGTLKDVKKASELILSTFDDNATNGISLYFLKTSTGKGFPGASVSAATAMLEAINDAKKNKFVGLKVSGGVRTVESAIGYSDLTKKYNVEAFRIGASSLLDEVSSNDSY